MWASVIAQAWINTLNEISLRSQHGQFPKTYAQALPKTGAGCHRTPYVAGLLGGFGAGAMHVEWPARLTPAAFSYNDGLLVVLGEIGASEGI